LHYPAAWRTQAHGSRVERPEPTSAPVTLPWSPSNFIHAVASASVLSSRRESWRQNCTNRVSPTVTGWPGRIQSPTAPVSPTCLPVIPRQGTIVNFVARNRNPAALNKHPHTVRLCSKWCRRAVPLRAATRAILVHEMTIDVVRTDRRGPKKNNEGQPQRALFQATRHQHGACSFACAAVDCTQRCSFSSSCHRYVPGRCRPRAGLRRAVYSPQGQVRRWPCLLPLTKRHVGFRPSTRRRTSPHNIARPSIGSPGSERTRHPHVATK
jgi:hypothetical protein